MLLVVRLSNTMEKFLKRKLTVLHETDESPDDSDSSKQKKKPAAKQRKYVDDYVKYGFVAVSYTHLTLPTILRV